MPGATEIKSGDVLRATYELKLGPYVFWAKLEKARVDFGFSGESDPFGHITFGSPTSGALWIKGECIAEYDRLTDRQAVVIPVVEGRKQPEKTVEAEPVTYMLNEAIRRLR